MNKISFLLNIILFSVCFLSLKRIHGGYYFELVKHAVNDEISDNYDHIDGSWIKSAKRIHYNNNVLCADLRENFKFKTNDYNSYYEIYGYNRDCINVNYNELINLENNNGMFRVCNNNSTNT